jgi:aspartate aminotransferase
MKVDLGPQLDRLLAAQERCDQLRLATLRRQPRDLCDLAYANAYGGPPGFVIDAIKESLEADRELDLQYTPYGGATLTRRRVAESLSRLQGLRFPWRNILLTPGAMAALNVVFRALAAQDSAAEVIVLTPCWLDYPLYLVNLGLRPVMVPVDPVTHRLDLNAIEAAISLRTRAIVFSQPGNPTGLIHSRTELKSLADLLKARGGAPIVLISDECHRDVLFDNANFVPTASIYPATVVVYSFGKALFIQGQRIGYIAVSPHFPDADALVTTFERLCRIMGFCTPTALMQLAVRKLLDHPLDFSAIAVRRQIILDALEEAALVTQPSQATFFLYPKVPFGDDFRFAERLAEHGLLVLPAPVFHHVGHFRLALTAPDDQIERGATILRQVVAEAAA